MNLHDDIMNIPHKLLDTQFADSYGRKLYAEGHRDARHAAAEMALQVDVRIEELIEVIKACQEWHKGDCWRSGSKQEKQVWQDHADILESVLKENS